MIGANDSRNVTYFNRSVKEAARRADVEVELREFSGVGHELPPDFGDEMRRALEWLEENKPQGR
jgi:hypothetical protein